VKYEFIKTHSDWSVSSQCRVLSVSRQGYYAWFKRQIGHREQQNEQLDVKIKQTFEQHKKRYSSPLITQELRASGEHVGQNRVANRMKVMSLKAKQARKSRVTTDSRHNKPVAPNLLKQDFRAAHPNQNWVSDITYRAPILLAC